MQRRRFLQALAALGLSSTPPARSQNNPRFRADPFVLGVASGYPRADGFVLWTRLAPVPSQPAGGMDPDTVPVRWEVAADSSMKNIVASGVQPAEAAWAHSVHVEVEGLEPARHYWYRFMAGDAVSMTGRTRTAPAAGATVDRLRYALASCQHYEQGYFVAYRHIIEDDPDLLLFVGDYIYEQTYGQAQFRSHGSPKANTLEDYRRRYALYKQDPDLKAAHAAMPWLLTWDDHEVENDYAGDVSALRVPREVFMARRSVAYKAYYEHMPLRRSMRPVGPSARLYTSLDYGSLTTFHILDNRQYRTPQPCQRWERGGGNYLVNCVERVDPAGTMLGPDQEQWLYGRLSASRTRWNLLAQQTLVSKLDLSIGEAVETYWTDAWDGYPVARERMLQAIADRRPSNPVFLGGDAHMFWVGELSPRFDWSTPAVASEICGTSVTSRSLVESWYIGALLSENPHLSFGHSSHRGYTRIEMTPKRLRADLRILDSVRSRDARCSTLASFAVEDGRPGPVRI